MRFIQKLSIVFGGLAALCSPAISHVGFDRPGGDYKKFVIRSGDPGVCAMRCERDPACKAWSFAYPKTIGPEALCWLKNKVRKPVANSCCVSGVRGAALIQPRSDNLEFGIDRVGADYSTFELEANPTGVNCEAACKADQTCRAWTYERPGYGSSSPRCHLKSRITVPRRNPCCISGVIR